MPATQELNTASAIWKRVLQGAGRNLSVGAARSIVLLEFTPEDKQRMRELAAKARDGCLTADDEFDISEYERAGNLLALMKSQARQRIKKASRSNGSGR
jgi:hypothetical protein